MDILVEVIIVAAILMEEVGEADIVAAETLADFLAVEEVLGVAVQAGAFNDF